MRSVAHYLTLHAHTLSGAERDKFARSAYNRYYYGCFLLLRAELEQFDPKWRDAPHGNLPSILKVSMRDRLRKERSKALKRGDYALAGNIQDARHAALKIADVITEAYAVRIVADYKPEVEVTFCSGKRFSLNNVELSAARNWERNISILLESLRSVRRQLNA